MLVQLVALCQSLAAVGVTYVDGCNQVSNRHINCSFDCNFANLFLVFFVKKSGLAHGDQRMDGLIGWDAVLFPWAASAAAAASSASGGDKTK